VSRLAFHHWNVIKPEWARFTDWFLNSPIHCVICGRAGYEYDYEEDDTGHKELIKTGVKMKAESEFGFEPSLLVEMMKIKHSVVGRDPDLKGWIHRAVILKDRSDRMNGAEIDNPTYKDFLPHLQAINIGGAHRVIDADRTSDDMFDDRDHSAIQRKRRVEIALEEIKDVFVQADINSRTDAGKKEMSTALREALGTAAWSAIQNMKPEELEAGLAALRERYEPPPTHADHGDGFQPGDKPHGPLSVGMDANVVSEEENGAEAEKLPGPPEKGSRLEEYADRYVEAWQNARPDADEHERLEWQQQVVGKRNRAHWGLVDYIRAIAELEGRNE